MPLYVFARRKGKSAEDAEDLTQGFFAHMLSKEFFGKADPEKGRLRTVLLRSFENFMANEWRSEHAAKRGGGVTVISIDAEPAEAWLKKEPAGDMTPELEFERTWAREILAQARAKVAADYAKAGKTKEFEAFADELEIGKSERPHSEIAAELGVEVGGVRFMGFKLRQRFRETLEQTVAETVTTREEAEEELQHLLGVFKS